MNNFYLTQTSLKDLESEETCPFRWKKQWIDKEIQFPSNEHLVKGNYFEYLVIGSGAITGANITDLPRLKNGEKSVEQLRIEAQAERAKRILNDQNDAEFLGFTIVNKQVEVKNELTKGTIDIVAEDSEGHIWLLDLKLTADLSSDRTKYSWGNNWNELDLIQLIHYRDLYIENYNVTPRLGLLVFDYSTQKRAEFGEIIPSNNKIEEKDMRFKQGLYVIDTYTNEEWPKVPSIKECERCPLTCEKRSLNSKLTKKIIKY